VAKPTDRERNWLVVDANGKTLGRLATQIADVLRGKRKPSTRRTSTPATSSWSSTPRRSR
jgi:ribosomal protein L13